MVYDYLGVGGLNGDSFAGYSYGLFYAVLVLSGFGGPAEEGNGGDSLVDNRAGVVSHFYFQL